ncbi:hypothetical protein [Streptomyces tendae]|uniref:hypothetical protein n=1 Tax=Streptomyces tendae TaxID=1932 RepID=UPI003657239C
MGAALHLAHAHQPPPGPEKKRKRGGGDGDGYDALVQRVYTDPRQTSESRELILMLAWLIKRDPNRYDADGEYVDTWTRAEKILGRYKLGRKEKPRLADLIDADRPRYEPDRSGTEWHSVCRAPMIRREGECGQHSVAHSFKVDPVTGWQTPVPYCRRHADWGKKHDAALRAMDLPEPIPNTGGLMPSFLVLKTGTDGWHRIYQWASQWTYSRWEPPIKYGVRADDWPVPGREPEPEPVRLRLVASEGNFVD